MKFKVPVGQKVKLCGRGATVLGVVKDFHFESLYDKVKPFMFRFARDGENVLIRLEPGKGRESIGTIETSGTDSNGLGTSYIFST